MSLSTGIDLLRATRTSLDKVEGLFNESFLPEEIQLYLNKSQFRLLDDLINKNFQQGTIRYEWLRPFQAESTLPAPAWGSGQFTANIDFPDDLYYFIAARAQVQINTACYSPNGVQKKHLNDPLIASIPENNYIEINQLDIQETGETSDREQNNFYGENYRNPRAELISGGLRLYRGRKFLVNAVLFDYIIKPNAIAVADDVVLPWSSSALEKIVDYTVEYMRLSIEDPAYQGNVQDFNLRTQNA